MKKTTAALLLAFSFVILLSGISMSKTWLTSMNIPTGGSCFLSEKAQKNPATRRVCLKGTCILYSEWIQLSDAERAALKQSKS